MSDELKHECGVTLLKLRKPLGSYPEHGGLQKLALLLEKQHNRGQDGAGIASLSTQATPGSPYFRVIRSNDRYPLARVLEKAWDSPFAGDLFLGHLRYGTFGGKELDACHPVVKESHCRNRTLLLAGNFNLTNSRRLFAHMSNLGHHLPNRFDTSILLHMVGHELEQALDVAASPDLCAVIARAAALWDGGFMICGLTGDGHAFALRDPNGIRPGFYYVDDQVAVVASERPAIQTAFDLRGDHVKELPPGHLLILTPNNRVELKPCLPQRELRRCVFERIYFSRSNDADIQRERRAMGRMLVPQILDELGGDLDNTVFSYIPNTAQICFHGVLDELLHHRNIRFGQVIVKDAKFRTFIADAKRRKNLDMHVYDIIYGQTRPGLDNLVLTDDSIVRGTTLRNLILPILGRLGLKTIIVVSAAPPIRYPDCYGIDMAHLGDLVAFRAAISLLEKDDRLPILHECVALAEADLEKPDSEMENRVRPIYDAIGEDELSAEIARLLTPPGFETEFKIIFQRLDRLRQCAPEHTGDWYFSGDYPTPGGYRVVNQSLVNYIRQSNERAY